MADREACPPLDLDTIQRLIDAGVLIGLPLRGGWTTVSAEEIQEWYVDPVAFDAKQEGVSIEELQAFEQAHGNLPCPALTRQGWPCGGYVGHAHTPAEWVRRLGERCHQHQERDTARSRR
jgi:hypothetical protein